VTITPFGAIRSRAVRLLRDDVDTDQIIPARFLTTTTRAGLGRHLFSDWRFDAAGAPRPGFPLDAPESAGASILVAGRNFGCGSSREHAPWALYDWGIRAVIATSFADIFEGNARKNGLLPVALGTDAHAELVRLLERDAGTEVTVDLERQTVAAGPAFRASFAIEPFAKTCLLDGVDEMGFLLNDLSAIADFERAQPRFIPTTSLRPAQQSA
jgi:3-isopropylmalate/(R)-2-methylmalate dehydratase small subunit